jgi:putative endonuclease
MYFVYMLVSINCPEKIYIGFTTDIETRLEAHNHKKSDYSKKFAPWKMRAYTAFDSESKAREFESYLKSGSGFAFLKKRLL